jgi:type IV pilus assembly protein PilB
VSTAQYDDHETSPETGRESDVHQDASQDVEATEPPAPRPVPIHRVDDPAISLPEEPSTLIEPTPVAPAPLAPPPLTAPPVAPPTLRHVPTPPPPPDASPIYRAPGQPVHPAAEPQIDPNDPLGSGDIPVPVEAPVLPDEPPAPPAPTTAALATFQKPAAEPHREKAAVNGWHFIDLDDASVVPSTDASRLLDASVARNYSAIPIAIDEKTRQVLVAVEDPSDVARLNNLRAHLVGHTVRFGYANPRAIIRHIESMYSAANEAKAISEAEEASRRAALTATSDAGDLGRLQGDNDSAAAQILKLTIEQALRAEASDIHIEPEDGALIVRIRVDGKLRQIAAYPTSQARNLMTKIKVDARMKSDNFFVPDSGVLQHTMPGGKKVDIRVEVAPVAWGPGAVMRLQQNVWRELSGLGFSEENERRIRRALGQKNGLLLATGPTGSGKTTTLYSALREKISPTEKIITLENPVEYQVPHGVYQHSINVAQKMTFAEGLRSILREDPDIVLVGEVRDRETAETAIDASMTGHLVLSTLHTNDAPGVVPRLLRMGIEPFLLSSSLKCVIGQRLMRRLCPQCRIGRSVDAAEVEEMRLSTEDMPSHIYDANPDGCENCFEGIAGRVPVHEVMLVGADLREAIADNAPQPEIVRLAREAGMTSMREDGWEKVKQGIASIYDLNESANDELV